MPDTPKEKVYIAIDLKSFYASVECGERGLDPLNANLVVADESRTDKTICLAVSPSLKARGVPGRPRLFEVKQRVDEINRGRKLLAPGGVFKGESYFSDELDRDPSLALSFIVAKPRMAYYVDYSSEIYKIYLRYIAPEDIVVYSIDEVFIDATPYLKIYSLSPRELAMMLIGKVLEETRITATVGIGSNLFLSKIAMDVLAKKMPPDANGVRIAELDERSFREKMWSHRPLTDFWRIGGRTAAKLENIGIFTMGDIARLSARNEDVLYKMFGINAELLIDHAWGWEPCEIKDIKAYKPASNSISSGQVLPRPYEFDKARLVVREMADALSFDLVGKALVTDSIVLTVNYDSGSFKASGVLNYTGKVGVDRYGKTVPVHAHGTAPLGIRTSSAKLITEAALAIFDAAVDPDIPVRRLNISAEHVVPASAAVDVAYEQLDLFSMAQNSPDKAREEFLKKEKRQQEAVVNIRRRFGKNSILKGFNFEEGATAIERNSQIGGHKA